MFRVVTSSLFSLSIDLNYLQAKAGLLDEAMNTHERMKAQGLQPTTWTLNILVNACARAKQPKKALELIERLQNSAGSTSSPATNNPCTLLRTLNQPVERFSLVS